MLPSSWRDCQMKAGDTSRTLLASDPWSSWRSMGTSDSGTGRTRSFEKINVNSDDGAAAKRSGNGMWTGTGTGDGSLG